ncbi:hypothetical protein GOP47_0007515 [Adiantum capillus-veneris]|uniref:Uncharacterized protein n=1 Tax=Adiantum capillus-veneris TaxID=13818 RepID=A0A9D4V1F8_ADICA|nr:hypothetical protein GOP47_0007515 [Adiantum capillus-veneris]
MEKPRLVAACVVLLMAMLLGDGALWLRPVAAYTDNCQGSSKCGCCVSQQDCRNAFARYTDGTIYSAYTSRVSGHCTAIYRCNGAYAKVSGAVLKKQFRHVYENQPCQKCGSHAFASNCEATLNYCSSCRDSGNPN